MFYLTGTDCKSARSGLRGQGLGRRQVNKAANQAIKEYQTAVEEGFQATQIGVKVISKTVEVLLSAVQAGALDEIKEQTINNETKI